MANNEISVKRGDTIRFSMDFDLTDSPIRYAANVKDVRASFRNRIDIPVSISVLDVSWEIIGLTRIRIKAEMPTSTSKSLICGTHIADVRIERVDGHITRTPDFFINIERETTI